MQSLQQLQRLLQDGVCAVTAYTHNACKSTRLPPGYTGLSLQYINLRVWLHVLALFDKLRETLMLWPAAVLVAAAAAAVDEIPLASFAPSAPKALRHTWSALNDPVMGGQSTSRVAVESAVLNFTGHCAIVPSLKAPGFSECLPCLSLPFSHAESDCHCHSPCHTITTC